MKKEMIRGANRFRFYLYVLGVFILFSNLVLVVSGIDISTCQSLSANTVYNLTSSPTANVNSSCFSASGNNITLDCGGYTITGNTSILTYGVFINNKINIIVRNCNFNNWTNGYSIFNYEESADNNTFENLVVTSTGAKILSYRGDNIIFNNITFQGAAYLYIYGDSSDNIQVSNVVGPIEIASTTSNVNLTNITWSGVSSPRTISGINITINNLTRTSSSADVSFSFNQSQILNSNFLNNPGRVYFGVAANNIILNNVNYVNNSGSVFSIGCDNCQNITINNSQFINNSLPLSFYRSGGLTNNLTNFIFTNSVLQNTSASFFYITSGIFSNNIIGNSGSVSFSQPYILNVSNNNLSGTGSINFGTFTDRGNYVKIFNNNALSIGNSSAFNLDNLNNWEAYNNTANGVGTQAYCFAIDNSSNGLVYNNTCTNAGHGIMFNLGSYNLTGYNNYVSNCSYSFLFEWGSHGNTFYNNTNVGGIFYDLHHTYNNTAYGNTIINSSIYLLDNVTNENYYDNYLVNSHIILIASYEGIAGMGVGIGASNNTLRNMNATYVQVINNSFTNNFINITIPTSINFTVDSTSSAYVFWYYASLVNDSNGNNIDGANVSVYSNSGNLAFSFLTNSSGLISQQILTEYFANLTAKYYSTNYTLNVTKIGYDSYSSVFNLTTNLQSVVTLSENVVPNVSSVSPVNSYSETSSSTAINFLFNVSDESDISNCTLYLNGASYSNISIVNKSSTNIIPVSVTPGDYSWYVNCMDSLGNMGNSSTNSFTIVAPVANSAGSSGNSVLLVSSTNMQKGYNTILYKNWQIKFNVSGESHNMIVNNISSGSVTFTVSSTPQTVSLNVGEEWKVNLNGKDYYDLYIKLNSVFLNRANVTIKSINEKIIIENHTLQDEEVYQTTNNNSTNFAWVWILILVLVIIAGILVLLKKHRT